jgi:hypothetical protein
MPCLNTQSGISVKLEMCCWNCDGLSCSTVKPGFILPPLPPPAGYLVVITIRRSNILAKMPDNDTCSEQTQFLSPRAFLISSSVLRNGSRMDSEGG